jgi:two-component system OmpR family sensor kinase
VININKILKNQISHLTPLAEKKKLKIIENYSDEIEYKIDEESLIRLLNNLIENAIKYNNIGGFVKITTKGKRLINQKPRCKHFS